MKLLVSCTTLFKINKIFENTLSLRVAGNGTKKPVATDVTPAFEVLIELVRFLLTQCFLKLLLIFHNLIYVMKEFHNYLPNVRRIKHNYVVKTTEKFSLLY